MQKWAGMSDFTSHADARYLCKEVLSYLGQLTLVFICALRGSDVLDCSRHKNAGLNTFAYNFGGFTRHRPQIRSGAMLISAAAKLAE